MAFLDELFGSGLEKDEKDENGKKHNNGGDRSFTAPVYGTDSEGNDVTVSFGRSGTKQEGETLIADGHVEGKDFYATDANGNSIGHDHADGKGGYADRGAYSGRK